MQQDRLDLCGQSGALVLRYTQFLFRGCDLAQKRRCRALCLFLLGWGQLFGLAQRCAVLGDLRHHRAEFFLQSRLVCLQKGNLSLYRLLLLPGAAAG